MKYTLTLSAIALALVGSTVEAASQSKVYGQCGGTGWTGATSCESGSTCVHQNDFYYQCVPDSAASSAKSTTAEHTSTKKTTTTAEATTKATIKVATTISKASTSCAEVWGQCGGSEWSGATCCPSGSTCVPQDGNKYYSQCIPNSSITSSATSSKATTTKKSGTKATTTTTKNSATKATTTKDSVTKAATTTTTTKASSSSSSSSSGYSVVSGGSSGTGTTTRYWDCCKASCSWPGKASVSSPVDTCATNGITLVDENTASGCGGGAGFMCNNNQPWAINDNLSYGFAAANIAGSNEAGWCCGCYELTFTSTAIAGKKMVVQVTNTGGDLGANHFDLQIPGGGVGIFNGCTAQWGAPSDGWGTRYGGVSSASDCSSLPSALQAGCKWRFNWFQSADNPTMTFKQVTCPSELVARTGCKRN